MIIKSNLIHSGLPWASPQKIAISASQYISNAVINRPLLHLLNNDYFLDIKTQAINKYIEENLATHISNQDIHVPWSRIQQLLSSYNILNKDSVYYIPIIFNNIKLNSTEINSIIEKIPKNLNGYTIVLYFCKAETNGLANTGIYDNNSIDLKNKSINIENFTGGDVILYSNSSKTINLEGYLNLQQITADTINNKSIFDEIQTVINKTTYITNNSTRLTIKSTGINQNYSTLSIKNCLANVHIVNMTIENTIDDWNKISDYAKNANVLPTADDVLIYYPLNTVNSDNTIPYVQEYLNKQVLYNNSSYYLNTVSNFTKTQLNNSNNEGGFNINNKTYIETKPTEPHYFTFDMLSQVSYNYPVSNEIRELLYDWKNTNNNYTIMFFGKISQDLFNNNQPIFIDYNNIGKEFGLYVYLNKIFTATKDVIDRSQYMTEFNSKYSDIIDNEGLFVIQFIHSAIDYKSSIDSNSSNISSIPLSDKKYMRINIIFYPLTTDIENVQPIVLSPNASTISSINNISNNIDREKKFIDTLYQFQKPTKSDYNDINIPIKLFAHKRLNNVDEISIKDWDYYSGYIKNLFIFRKVLTPIEIKQFLSIGKANTFEWLSAIEKQIINSITNESFIGTIYVKNSSNVNLINSEIKTNLIN